MNWDLNFGLDYDLTFFLKRMNFVKKLYIYIATRKKYAYRKELLSILTNIVITIHSFNTTKAGLLFSIPFITGKN